MKKTINQKNIYTSISITAGMIAVFSLFIIVFLYYYGGFNDIGEFAFWVERKIRYIF